MIRALVLCVSVASLSVAPPPACAEGSGGGVVFVFGQTAYLSEAMETGGGGQFVFGTSVYGEETRVQGDPVDDVCVEVDSAIEVDGVLAAVTEGDHVSVGSAASEDACAAGGGHWMGSAAQLCDADIEVVVDGGPGQAAFGCITVRLNADLEPADGFVIIDNIEG
jgi:hypothetical protein